MKIRCLQENAQRALQITSRITPSRTTMPIVQNVLLRAREGTVEIIATNLETTVRMQMHADVEREGDLTIPNRLLNDFVNTLPKEPMVMEQIVGTSVLKIECGNSKANVHGANASLFPPMPEVMEDNTVIITAEEFKKAIGRVAHCAATESGRPVLTGILMELEGDRLTTVGADGFRMAVQRSKLNNPPEKNTKVIVPARTLLEVQRIAGNTNRQVEIRMAEDEKNIRFIVGSEETDMNTVEVTSLLLTGNYPDYGTLIPQDMPNRAVFSLEDLSRSTRRAEIFAKDDNHTIRFQMNRGKGNAGQAVVISEAKDLGNNKATLQADEMKGGSVSIALNGKYVQEALSSINSEKVQLESTSGTAPVKIEIPGDEDYVHVMMPVMTLEDQ